MSFPRMGPNSIGTPISTSTFDYLGLIRVLLGLLDFPCGSFFSCLSFPYASSTLVNLVLSNCHYPKSLSLPWSFFRRRVVALLPFNFILHIAGLFGSFSLLYLSFILNHLLLLFFFFFSLFFCFALSFSSVIILRLIVPPVSSHFGIATVVVCRFL